MHFFLIVLFLSVADALMVRDHYVIDMPGGNSTDDRLWISKSSRVQNRLDKHYAVHFGKSGDAPYLPQYKYDSKVGDPPWLVKTTRECTGIPHAARVSHTKWIVTNGSVADIANIACVLYIKPRMHHAVVETKEVDAEPSPRRVLRGTGKGLTVFIADTSLDPFICPLNDDAIEPPMVPWTISTIPASKHKRIVAIFSQHGSRQSVNDGSHGTKIACIIAGSGCVPGYAPEAKILFLSMSQSATETDPLLVPPDMGAVLTRMGNLGATVSCFAWAGIQRKYDVVAEDVDNYVYHHPEMLIVSSAMNDHADPGSLCVAKNPLCVGSSSFVFVDGRVVPTILVKRHPMETMYAFSSKYPGHDDRHTSEGNSLYAAEYAGMALLLQETYDTVPWSVVIKSNLLISHTRVFTMNGTQASTVHAVATGGRVAIALSWIDPPAMDGSAAPLVYDLDFLVAVDGKQIRVHTDKVNTFQVAEFSAQNGSDVAIYIISVDGVKWGLALDGLDVKWSDTCLHDVECEAEDEYKSCVPDAKCRKRGGGCDHGSARFCDGGVVQCSNGVFGECDRPRVFIQTASSAAPKQAFSVIYVVLLFIIHNG